MHDWSSNPLTSILKIVIPFIMLVYLTALVTRPFYDEFKKSSIEDSIHIGTVTDKKIINPQRGIFTSSGRRYQIVISFEYEYDGETYEGERSIDVDEDVYLSYNVGDTFDSHNPVPNDKKESASKDDTSAPMGQKSEED